MADDEFSTFVLACEQHRVLGMLGSAARAGDFAVSEQQWRSLAENLDAWLAHALRVERLLLNAAASLRRAGIETRVLKGIPLAHLAYPDPADRVFADADVLVDPRRFTEAASVLANEMPVHRALPELRPGFDDRFGREILMLAPGTPNPLELDLHRSFVDGPYGLLLDPEELFRNHTPFRLAGHDLAALDAEDLFLQACYSAVLADRPPRLVTLRDIAQIVRAFAPDFDEVRVRARRRRAEVLVAEALRLAYVTLAIDVAPELTPWARHYRIRARDRFLLASYSGRARALTEKLATAAIVPGRFSYLHAVAYPHQAYLDARGLTRTGYLAQSFGAGHPRSTVTTDAS